MANEEHVALLKRGVDAWNEWREKNPGVRPDLSEANLNGEELPHADLSWVNLRGANLRGANLSRVDLSKKFVGDADLSWEKPSRRFPSGADLTGADLSEADLSGANLSAVDLRGTNLVDATLDKANLTAAKLWDTHRAGWSIKGVSCEYTFWDREAKEPTYYAAGEFQRLHSEALKIELHYKGGMNPIEVDTLPMLIRHLQTRHEGTVLRLRSIEDAPGGPTARIVIEDSGDEDPASLVKDLQQEAEAVQSTLRENLTAKEEELKVLEYELNVLYNKIFPKLLESKSMAEAKQINIHGNVGTIGDITDNANVHIDQSTHYNQNDITKITHLVTDILARQAELQPDLPTDRLADLQASLNTMQAQLTQQTPDSSLIKSSLATIKTILEGATANVLARGWLKVLDGVV